MKQFKKCLLLPVFLCLAVTLFSQFDSTNVSFHFQQTLVTQKHAHFSSPYQGDNSLEPDEQAATSLTNTLFFAVKPWRHTLLFVNPEVAGGQGLSGATGIAGFTNGEVFRVGNPKPTLYLARLVLEQSFPLKNSNYENLPDEANNVAGEAPVNYVKVFGGRFCLADYFDDNPYSHDPRSQFLNWSFMSAGAWDYAADTRGYTWGAGAEWKRAGWRAAFAMTMMPEKANALKMDGHLSKAFATQAELTHYYSVSDQPAFVQATVFFNKARMGNYEKATKHFNGTPDITSTADYNHHKWGWVLNTAQQLTNDWGIFGRASWNDGKNETWAYTEIDRSINVGVQWSKKEAVRDHAVGVGVVTNGLSPEHRNYLAAGGYGFIIGDGRLQYAAEWVAEAYFRVSFFKNHFQLSPDYQFVVHPAYNADRGPVHVFALRSHVEL